MPENSPPPPENPPPPRIPIAVVTPKGLNAAPTHVTQALGSYYKLGLIDVVPSCPSPNQPSPPNLITEICHLLDPEGQTRRQIAAGNLRELAEASQFLDRLANDPTVLLFILNQVGSPAEIAALPPLKLQQKIIQAIAATLALHHNIESAQQVAEWRQRILTLAELAKDGKKLAALTTAAQIVTGVVQANIAIASAQRLQLQERVYNWGAIMSAAGSGWLGGLLAIMPGIPLSGYSYLLELFKFHEKKHPEIGIGLGASFITIAIMVIPDLVENGQLEPNLSWLILPALAFLAVGALAPTVRFIKNSLHNKK